MEKYVIFGNYGNETIGLIQWAAKQNLQQVWVVSVNTQWAAVGWPARVEAGEKLAKSKGFRVERLQARLGFAELVKEHGDFPSNQYQWCAGFLKALPFIDWLDALDPSCEAILLLGNRRALAKSQAKLTEYIDESEHFDRRKVWHPLYQHTNDQLHELVIESELAFLQHRSLECDPCVNNCTQDFLHLQNRDVEKTVVLEKSLKKDMFAPESYGDKRGVEQVIQWVEKNPKSDTLALIDMGCGSPFGCGL